MVTYTPHKGQSLRMAFNAAQTRLSPEHDSVEMEFNGVTMTVTGDSVYERFEEEYLRLKNA